MATAAFSSSSPSYSSAHSPRFRGNSPNVSSPWSPVVRRATSPPSRTAAAELDPSDRSLCKTANRGEPTEAGLADSAGAPPLTSESTDQGGTGDSSASSREKKSAWNRPSDGLIEEGAVMGADSWPALSEATKAPPKSSSYDSLKGLSNGSVPDLPAPVTTSPPPPKPAHNNTNYNSSANHAVPTRQKSMKRGGSSSTGSKVTTSNDNAGALTDGGLVRPKSQPTLAVSSHNRLDNQVNSEPSPRELTSRSGGGFSPQSHGGHEHQKTYSGNRRGNNAGGGRGHHHNNFGNRPEHERGSYDWSGHRSFRSGRDMQVQQQQPMAITRPFLRPPLPGSAPFIAPPPPIRPFGNPMGYPDIPPPLFYVPARPPPESFRGMPFVVPPAMFFSSSDMRVRTMLLKQIDYYFSSENLCKDVYLRQNMDEEGWVPISLIAGFNRVRNLTTSIQLILDTVRTSTIVEVQGDKIRRRHDWTNWPLLTPTQNLPHSSMPNHDALASRLTHIGLEGEGVTSESSMNGAAHTEVGRSRSFLGGGGLTAHPQVAASAQDSLGQTTVRNGSDHSVFGRS